MAKINADTIKYWHTATLKNGIGSYEEPALDGVKLTEIRRHDDGKTYVYHVPADEIANCEAALDEVFKGENQ
jgi:hypothetical protein